MIVAFEGIDNSGKTTQINLLSESLTKQNIKNVIFSFPDRTTDIGKLINNFLKQNYEVDKHVIHLLFSANRYEKVKKINEYLKNNYIILLDRWFYSGIVYSIAQDIDEQWCYEIEKFLRTPDIIFYFNTFIKHKELEKYDDTKFQNKVKKIFDEILVNTIKIDNTLSVYDILQFIENKIKHNININNNINNFIDK